MRVLHVVKTSDGADWAARQALVLVQQGIEVHVAVPQAKGRALSLWEKAGAYIHIVDLSFPARRPWAMPKMCVAARQLVKEVKPDLIHSHFVSTTLLLRIALGRNDSIPRVFQVPGPLHLEHAFPRVADLATAGANDYWIGSSRCIFQHYRNAGIDSGHVFLSYYGGPICSAERNGYLRRKLGVEEGAKIVGNINLIYPPKTFLGQRVGLKCHEDVIDAIGIVQQSRSDVVGVLIGGTFGLSDLRYEDGLKTRARKVGQGRILMPGYFGTNEVMQSWPDFDCAVHVPLSENCGGIIEPLMAEVPTIAGIVGGLPEVVINGITGLTIPIRNPQALASSILTVLDDPEPYQCMAVRGRKLIMKMFDVERTGSEIVQIYRHIIEGSAIPTMFSAKMALNEIRDDEKRASVNI
jgi:glycosyltransferase involved in cell wall biosynthesis